MEEIIYKYILFQTGDDMLRNIRLPEGSKILSVQQQGVNIVIWVRFPVENKNKTKEVQFLVVMTGHIFFEHGRLKHLATVQMEPNTLVFHIFQYV